MSRYGSVMTAMSVLFVLLGVTPGASAAEYENPPVLAAEEVLGTVPLSGADYEISPSVPTDGFMARITITSPFGEFIASGPGMLSERLNDIRALAVLQQLQDVDSFKEAAGETAEETVGNLKTLAENPRETLKGVPEGVGRFFSRTGRSIRTGVQKLGDAREGRVPGVDPEQSSNLPGGSGAPVAAPDPNLARNVAKAGGDVAVNVLGYDKQRRRLAKELGVDPYTTNAILSDKLDEVTWAAFAGGLGVNVVTSLIPGGMMLSTSSQLTNWVWDTAPGDLRVAIEKKLLSMGVRRDAVDRLLRHGFYTLSMQAVLVESLEDLQDVEGRADVIPLALAAGSEGQARFVVQTLDMLRNYHKMREPLEALILQGTVVGRTRSGGLAVMAPVDYLSWTGPLDSFITNVTDISEAARELQVTGRISDLARGELARFGWTVEEDSALGPSAYPVH